jgi:hypothetical protein
MSTVSLRDVPRELRDVVRDALDRGWELTRRKAQSQCHMRLVHPDHRPIPVASSCSEGRASKKLLSQIKRVEEGRE